MAMDIMASFRRFRRPSNIAITAIFWMVVSLDCIGLKAQPELFMRSDKYSAGFLPQSLRTGDFNGDGNLDIVVASQDKNVWVLLGKGDGTFRTTVAIPVDGLALNVAVGDVNRDGKLDVVVAAYIPQSNISQTFGYRVFLLLGNGDGTFKPAIDLAIPGANYVALSDLNGDGNPDLIIAAISRISVVAIYLGRGDGSFEKHVTLPIADSPHSDIIIADFNGDGKPDLAVNTDSGVLSVLISKGGGDFQGAMNTPVGRSGTSAEFLVADFNADGKPDLAVAENGIKTAGGINVLLGKGDGTFLPPIVLAIPPPAPSSDLSQSSEPGGLAVADFDGDGIPDLFAGMGYSSTGDVVVLLGKGDGNFSAPIRFKNSPNLLVATVVGDFNHDGKPDLASAYLSQPNGVSVLITGEPSFYIRGIVNAASHNTGNVARGEIITISGTGLGPTEEATQQITPDGLVDTTLAGVRVLFNGRPVPLLSVRSDRITAIVLYTAGPAPDVQVENKGQRTRSFSLLIDPAAPGIFTADDSGRGQGIITNEDGTANSESNPAQKGSVITFFATGEGLTIPDGVDGKLSDDPPPVPVLPVTIGINDAGAELISAGGSPGLVAGFMRVVARIPDDAPSGSVKINIGVGGYYSQQGVTVAIE